MVLFSFSCAVNFVNDPAVDATVGAIAKTKENRAHRQNA